MIDKRTKNTGGEAEEVIACCGFDSSEAYTSKGKRSKKEKKRNTSLSPRQPGSYQAGVEEDEGFISLRRRDKPKYNPYS